MEYLGDRLLKEQPFESVPEDKMPGGRFYKALLEELCFQYENNGAYQKFCQNKGFDPHGFQGELQDIPPVHVSVFKEMGTKLASVGKEEIKLTLQSSATSGVPSSVPLDKLTSKRQSRAMVQVLGSFIGNERRPFLIMDIDPASGFKSQLGARFAAVSGYLRFATEAGFFLNVTENGKYYFDTKAMEHFIEKLDEGQPAVVFGFTYLLFSQVIKPLQEKGVTFRLPKGSKIIHIGGWKKLEQEKVSKDRFNADAAHLFGISPQDVVDVYGFTEQMGLNYPDCPCGCKHTSLYSEVIVRDLVTKEVLPPGEEGLLEFVTFLPHSYPGNVVLTDDVGYIEKGSCGCGRAGKRFHVTGRLKKAEIRGCGDILSGKLRFSDRMETYGGNKKDSFKIEYFHEADELKDQDVKTCLKAMEDSLRKHLSWIRRQPADALTGLIGKTAGKWAGGDRARQTGGIGFLAEWCRPENLNALLTRGLRGNRHYIDGFFPVGDSTVQHQKAVSKGIVCHWLAGNVQALGMFVLIESILTKNVNLVKISSRDNGMFRSLLEAFEGESFTTMGGYTIYGDDLLKTIGVVYFDHEDIEAGKQMSEIADVRVAWGGREAVMAVTGYPSKLYCEDLIMGPKLSFAVVSREALQDRRRVRKLARRIAVDASVFDQTGCASVHNVFVEHGGAISPEEFAGYLAEGMEKAAVQIPKGPMSLEEISAVHSARGIYDFKGVVYGDKDSVWSVLYSDAMELCSPVYSRVVFVHPIKDMNDVLPYADETIQTIGLAADGERAGEFAREAADRGVMRFPAPGKMLNFDSPWDGMYLTDRMVRWVTLGGPLV
ncbi:MAG: acyl-CoA reductase [Hungatella sp.]|nr:acyl-CoA reductase [Hungatella sp.]